MISFLAEKNAINEAMRRLAVIIPKRDSGTLLSHVLLSISPTDVSITASDMESTARIIVPAKNTSQGNLIAKAKTLSDIAATLKSEYFLFSAEEQEFNEKNITEDVEELAETRYQIIIQGSDNSITHTMPGGYRSHFPKVNEIPADKLSFLSASLLLEMINKTFYAVSEEENRYIYSGLYMKADKNQITLVGTDGRRLSAITRKLPKPIQLGSRESGTDDNNSDSDDIVVYSKAVKELRTLLSDAEGDIQLGVEQKDIFFRVDNAELSSRLLEGKFPDYEKVIPKEKKTNLTLSRRALLDAFEEIIHMAEEPSRQVQMQVQKEKLTFQASTLDVGKSEKIISIDYQGEDIDIYFNGSYVQDILKHITSDEVLLSIEDKNKPIMIHDPEDPDFISLVMPMRI